MRTKRQKADDKHDFNYNWKLSDGYPAPGIKYHGSKVFSCFACGGGSTMGYKLAGFDVIGANEIDPKMAEAYKVNHNPKHLFVEDIREFRKRKDLPEELFNLDILDGSPPCSSFSMSGNRSKDWGKEKKFREGQKKQVLDDLFFEFIELTDRLKPKIVVAENVKGLLLGEANKYVNEIRKSFKKIGYTFDYYLLNSSNMGVPQKRERVFFICVRNDISKPFLVRKDLFNFLPEINLEFNKKEIPFFQIEELNASRKSLSPAVQEVYNKRLKNEYCLGSITERLGKRKFFNYMIIKPNEPCYTITAKDCIIYDNGYITKKEILLCGSYPLDYNFLKNQPNYMVGMSVPPVMVAQIANEIHKQWLSKL